MTKDAAGPVRMSLAKIKARVDATRRAGARPAIYMHFTQELYRKPPIRYTSALGQKAWLPCAWIYKTFWSEQVDLARKTGAAVGLTNGWGDGFGLARLPEDTKQQMLCDIG